MKITWIIGNGFDINLGLRTSYVDFYNRHYGRLDDGEIAIDRERLEAVAPRGAEPSPLWSDLESLLGRASSSFDSFDEFYDLFQRMQTEIELYVADQDGRFSGDAESQAFYLEFIDSLFHPFGRLDGVDKEIALDGLEEGLYNSYSVINLNYTTSIEKILYGAAAFLRERKMPDNLETGIEVVAHPHGSLEFPRQIVFGVSEATQLANTSFRQDEECLSCLTKVGRDAVYGNRRIDLALDLISKADVIVTFGCSFGNTDEHLWRAIGHRLKEEHGCNVVCFDYGLPEKGVDLRSYMRTSREKTANVCSAFGVASDETIHNRIVVCNSGRVFRFLGEATPKLVVDPFDLAE